MALEVFQDKFLIQTTHVGIRKLRHVMVSTVSSEQKIMNQEETYKAQRLVGTTVTVKAQILPLHLAQVDLAYIIKEDKKSPQLHFSFLLNILLFYKQQYLRLHNLVIEIVYRQFIVFTT